MFSSIPPPKMEPEAQLVEAVDELFVEVNAVKEPEAQLVEAVEVRQRATAHEDADAPPLGWRTLWRAVR